MKEEKGQNFLQGAMVLAAATITVKIIGALFKIPLANILGGVGMSYFVTAYDLFNPIYALTVTGMSVAVSKLVSEYLALGREKTARRVFRVSLGVFALVGVLGSLAMAACAGIFVRAVNNEAALWAVYAIAPAMLFSCASAAFRGYYQGRSNMVPTALSQIVEACVKLCCGIAFSYGIVVKAGAEYSQTGRVFGVAYPSLEAASFAILPAAAAGAILGVTVSTLAGCLFIMLRHRVGKRALPVGTGEKRPVPRGLITRKLLAIAVPVSLSAVVVNLTSLIDLASVMNRLQTAMDRDLSAVLSMYQGLLPEGMELSMLPEYLYGSYSGLAMSIFNLIPAITTSIAVSALPAVTSAWATQNRALTRQSIESVLRITLLIALPAGVGICALSGPILNLLFSGRAMEAAIIAPVLRVMGLSAIFVALTSASNSMLQAVGRVDLPVKLMLVGGVIKLAVNYLAVAIPSVNIQGVPYGTLLCYVFIVCASLFALCRNTHISLAWGQIILRPLLAAVGCGLAAWSSFGLLTSYLGERLSTVASIGIGGIFYLLVLLLSGGVCKEDVIMLPMGEKLAKILAKHRVIR